MKGEYPTVAFESIKKVMERSLVGETSPTF